LTKLWNIARFISCFPQVHEDYELAPLDRMILGKLNELVEECRSGYEEMNAFSAATAIRTFTWNIFADHYIEAAKSRAYNRDGVFDFKLQKGAWHTLHKCLETILKLLAPICPFITEAIWLEIYSKEGIHLQGFPQENPGWETNLVKLLPKFVEFNNAIWQHKKCNGLALSQELTTTIYAPIELEPLVEDIKTMHRIRSLSFGKPKSRENIEQLSEDIFAIK